MKGYIGRFSKGDLYVHIQHFEVDQIFTSITQTNIMVKRYFKAKYRKRYLRLNQVNEDTRKTFEIRAKVVFGVSCIFN